MVIFDDKKGFFVVEKNTTDDKDDDRATTQIITLLNLFQSSVAGWFDPFFWDMNLLLYRTFVYSYIAT